MSPTESSSGNSPTGDNPVDLGLPEQDVLLLAELATVLELADPVPEGMTDRIRFAMDLDDLEFEVARWQRESELAAAGVRGSVAPDTITFTVGDLTVMVSLAPATNGNRFDGWLVPGGPHTVEVRVEGHDPVTATADDGGRFVLDDVPKGITQIVVHVAGQRPRSVVTPTIVL